MNGSLEPVDIQYPGEDVLHTCEDLMGVVSLAVKFRRRRLPNVTQSTVVGG